MSTKNNPGQFDCYANAEPDEPMFILLGRDPLAPLLVRLWALARQQSRGTSEKSNEAYKESIRMMEWSKKGASVEARAKAHAALMQAMREMPDDE